MDTDLTTKSIAEIGRIIAQSWPNPYFGAVPYIEALQNVPDGATNYGADSVKSVVLYFLVNAGTWRGETAKAVKAELKKRTKK